MGMYENPKFHLRDLILLRPRLELNNNLPPRRKEVSKCLFGRPDSSEGEVCREALAELQRRFQEKWDWDCERGEAVEGKTFTWRREGGEGLEGKCGGEGIVEEGKCRGEGSDGKCREGVKEGKRKRLGGKDLWCSKRKKGQLLLTDFWPEKKSLMQKQQ